MRASLTLAFLIVVFGGLSAWLGADASWDFRNYHLYDAHAVLAGTLWTDIAPAQLQSFYDPGLDLARYLVRRALNAHPAALGFVLAVPHAVAVWLALGLACDAVSPRQSQTLRRHGGAWPGHPQLYVRAAKTWMAGPSPAMTGWLCTLFGATGAGVLPTLGMGMSEMPAACLILLALRRIISGAPCWLPGLLAGAAVGLKLTNAPYALGLGAAVLASRPRQLPAFLAAAALAALVIAGPWWWDLWRHTGNPLFPYFNDLFRSPWASAAAMTDTRFLPRNLWQTLLFPALWAFHPSTASGELPARDPRLLLGLLACIGLVLGAALRRRRPARPLGALLAFWLVAFASWEARFGILRYAAVLELLSGIPVAFVLARLVRRRAAVAVLAAVTASVAAATIYPDWGRAQPGRLAAYVRPPFAPGSLVLLLDPAPMAYVAAFSPPGVRFAGVNNNLVQPGDTTGLARAAAAAIAARRGPLWGLESPADQPGQADRALRFYALERSGPCVTVRSNLDADALRACRLKPLPASEARDSPMPPGRG